MAIISALYAGVSGLQVLSDAMQVISDNISNMNTVGFKASRADFSDMLSQSISGSALSSQIGRGVTLNSISTMFSQGSLQSTPIGTDLAINGNGFFVLTDGVSSYYTRAGVFRLNNDGYLVNADGYKVVGYQYDSSGQDTGMTGTLNLSNLTTPPRQTGDGTIPGTGVTIHVNLDSSAVTPSTAWDVDSPAATSNFSTSITIFDSLGNSHDITVYFRKEAQAVGPPAVAENTWSWHAVIDGGEITGGTAGTNFEGANGTLIYTNTGALDQEVAGTIASSWSFANGAAPAQVIGFDFGDSITTDSGTGLAGSTQFSGESYTNFQSRDGFPSGNLRSITVNEDGVITGVFSNGRTRDVGRIAVANFPNAPGLSKIGNNLLVQSYESGTVTLSSPGVGAAGKVSSSTLELSNVDLANEFVNLITLQRSYQANSRVITTGDTLLNEIVNLKR